MKKLKDSIVRKYDSSLPRKRYNKQLLKGMKNLKWGQRKLLMAEIDFLTRYYDSFDKNSKKYVLYVGASPGYHINYLIYMFPEIHFILYDKVDSAVVKQQNVEFHQKYFDNNEAHKYKNMNLFFISDIRSLTVGKYLDFIRQSSIIEENTNTFNEHQAKASEIIYQDMVFQQEWCKIIRPKEASLKFRVSWETPFTTYYDGTVYFQIWAGNESIELRLVPDLNSSKKWDNKEIEEICFYYNLITRRKKILNEKNPCIGNYHESLAEASIIKKYLKKFYPEQLKENTLSVCDVSLSISLYLLKGINNIKTNKSLRSTVDPVFLKQV